jgi:prepilin-type processing-associated H-X9-DG protein
VERSKRGLSFVEVIAIIIAAGLLVCVGVTRFIADKQPPRRAYCMRNLKEIGLALHMYAQDFNQCFPTTVGVNENGKPPIVLKAGDGLAGLDILFKMGYIKDLSLLGCPTVIDWKQGVDPTDKKKGISAKGCTKDNCHYGYDPRHKATHPAGTAIMADRSEADCGAGKNSPSHDGCGQNVLFIDGHVSWWSRTAVGDKQNEIFDGSDDAADPEGASHIIQ